MRPSWDPIRTLLGRSWGSLAGSWALLGRSWGTLGRSWGAPNATKNEKNTDSCLPCCFLAAFGPVLAPLGLILVPPGLILRALWQYFWYQSLHNLSSCLFFKTLQRMVPIVAKVHIIIGFEAATRFPGTWVGISIDLPPRLAGNLLGVRCSSSWQQSLGTPPGCGGLREAVYNNLKK